MKDAKQLFLSVAKEVLEVTEVGEVPDNARTSAGLYVDFALGICALSHTCGIMAMANPDGLKPWLTAKFKQWPKFSGVVSYPVPGVFASSATAFASASPAQMWSPSHPYGALRRELLQFLIDELEKELNTEEL